MVDHTSCIYHPHTSVVDDSAKLDSVRSGEKLLSAVWFGPGYRRQLSGQLIKLVLGSIRPSLNRAALYRLWIR